MVKHNLKTLDAVYAPLLG